MRMVHQFVTMNRSAIQNAEKRRSCFFYINMDFLCFAGPHSFHRRQSELSACNLDSAIQCPLAIIFSFNRLKKCSMLGAESRS